MSIQDIRQKINRYIGPEHLFWIATIYGVVFLMVGLIGLALHVQKTDGISITQFDAFVFNEKGNGATAAEAVYASKTGSRYYYEDCAGLKRIKEENREMFQNAIFAEKAGYEKAANCH
jgi:hypothetical protein